jgi:hypothetical protein
MPSCRFLLLSIVFSGRKSKLSTRHLSTASQINDVDCRSLLVHDVDNKSFYQMTSEKLNEAKRLFSQSLISLTHNHHSWEQSLTLMENSIRFYERLIRDINLDTVHLYEYGRREHDRYH